MYAGIGIARGAGLSIQFAFAQMWRVLPAPTKLFTIGVGAGFTSHMMSALIAHNKKTGI